MDTSNMSTSKKNNKIKIAELSGIKMGALGTLDLELKLGRMRKPQNFTIYPIKKGDETMVIQSDKRITMVSMDGRGLLSKNHQNGAHFHHLKIDSVELFKFSKSDWENIKNEISKTSGGGSSSVVGVNNSGASDFTS